MTKNTPSAIIKESRRAVNRESVVSFSGPGLDCASRQRCGTQAGAFSCSAVKES